MVLLRSILPTPGSQGAILVFGVLSPKCFAQPGDRHSCQASNTGFALEKRKEIFKKILVVIVGVRKKMPSDGAEFSKRPPRHRRNQNLQSLNVWRQLSFKSARTKKKFFETDITLERKEIISSFERKSSLRASPKTFRSGRLPPTPATCHSPMTDISVIRPLRWSFWWRIYPSYGHWDDHFDDGYIRHMAINGLKGSSYITKMHLKFFCRSLAVKYCNFTNFRCVKTSVASDRGPFGVV